jgi:ABC-type uncharacterized transport system substrate-binding protein
MPRMRLRLLQGAFAVALLCLAVASAADAHPHVWITVETTVLHENGAFVGLRHKWTFDEFYTATAIEGLDKNKDGIYDREELAELAKVNIDGLKDFSYFTYAFRAGQKLGTGEARDYWLEHKGGLLSLHFTLPFASPLAAEAKGFAFAIHDPEFFIAFELAGTGAIKLGAGTPKGCAARVGEPERKPEDGSALGELQAQLGAFGGAIQLVSVDCNGP